MGSAVFVHKLENKLFSAELSIIGVEYDGALPPFVEGDEPSGA